MNKIYLLFYLTFLLSSGLLSAYAQQGVVAAGGKATGSGGTMSFSTGQTDFMHFSSEAGSIQFGLQQHFFFEDDDAEFPLTRQLTTGDISQGEDQCFDAAETIILAGGGDTFIVDANTGVDLIAGESIRMLPGTRVEHGGYMHARITSSSGPFCDVEEAIVATMEGYAPEQTASQEPLTTNELDNPDKPFFKVYPNPTTGEFMVEIIYGYTDAAYTIKVYGMRGEVIIHNVRLTGLQQHLSLQGRQPGLYMVRVQRGHDVHVERIIKR